MADIGLYIIGYGKGNKIVLDGYYDSKPGISVFRKIRNCRLVTFRAENIMTVWKWLSHCFDQERYYAPLAFSDNNDILFFPKLRYQDIYLLRQLLVPYFRGQEYHIAFVGRENLITVF